MCTTNFLLEINDDFTSIVNIYDKILFGRRSEKVFGTITNKTPVKIWLRVVISY